MEKYRKPNQYYIDDYDCYTIKILKQLEKEEAEKEANLQTFEEKSKFIIERHASRNSFLHNAVMRARHKEKTINDFKKRDEEQDRLVAKHPEPHNVRCNTCSSVMQFCTHFFKEDDAEILFVFECPSGHAPKKILYPNGKEFHFPEMRCEKCGGKLKSRKKKTKTKITFIEFCTECDWKTIDEYDLSREKEGPIDEEERKKYCTAYINRRTFWEDLEAIAEFAKFVEEQDKEKAEREKYNVDDLQRINIPQLEKKLSSLIEKAGYIKLSFEKPSFSKHTVIEFSLQDPTERNEKDSIKQLQKLVTKDLLQTNWRLSNSSLSYRMAYLTGKLKGYEQDDDLIKLAKEIFETKK